MLTRMPVYIDHSGYTQNTTRGSTDERGLSRARRLSRPREYAFYPRSTLGQRRRPNRED